MLGESMQAAVHDLLEHYLQDDFAADLSQVRQMEERSLSWNLELMVN